jgi:hypothetical protein
MVSIYDTDLRALAALLLRLADVNDLDRTAAPDLTQDEHDLILQRRRETIRAKLRTDYGLSVQNPPIASTL